MSVEKEERFRREKKKEFGRRGSSQSVPYAIKKNGKKQWKATIQGKGVGKVTTRLQKGNEKIKKGKEG